MKKVYTSNTPATHKMGRPTHRRHSSTRARIPMRPIIMYRSFCMTRADIWTTFWALTA